MWFVSLAFAVPPEGVVVDDLDRWERQSQALLAGPKGCWELAGKVELLAAGYVPASRWSGSERRDHAFTGEFVGRLEDGVWTSFRWSLDPVARKDEAADEELDLPLFPMMGRIDPEIVERTDLEPAPDGKERESISFGTDGEGKEALNTLQRILDGLDPKTATSYAEWSEADRGIRLFQDVPLSDAPRADTVAITTFFPEGGPHGDRLDAIFPRRVKVGDGLVKATMFDAQMHLRGQVAGDGVLPALESLSVGVGAFGFTIGYEQRLTYQRATRCTP